MARQVSSDHKLLTGLFFRLLPYEAGHDPEIFGTLNEEEYRYENSVMGLGCVLEDWWYMTAEEYFSTYTVNSIIDPEETAKYYSDAVLSRYAENYVAPNNVTVGVTYPTESFLEQYDDASWIQIQKDLLEQGVNRETCEALNERMRETFRRMIREAEKSAGQGA